MIKKYIAFLCLTLLLTAVTQPRPAHSNPLATIGDGTAASCQTNEAVNAFALAVAAGGVVDFNCGPENVIMNVNTNVVDKTVTVNGNGRIALSGEGLRQHFLLIGSANLTLNDISLIDGHAAQGGAIAIESGASATINRSFLTGNEAESTGGAIYNQGTLTINHSTLGSNSTNGNGGAIGNVVGTVVVRDSYIINNQATHGGGLYTAAGQLALERTAVRSNISDNQGGGLSAFGNTQITNVTFSNNRALYGGGIYVGNVNPQLNLLNATFNENRADTGGAIYRNQLSSVNVRNSILAGSLNTAGNSPSLNCDGPSLTSQGRNLISDNSCTPYPSANGDLHSTNPLLGIWFGTPTRGYIPAANSPAVDYALSCPAEDQRGFPRPIGAGCEVGSIERGWLVLLPMVRRLGGQRVGW